jgi:hypothetical protein
MIGSILRPVSDEPDPVTMNIARVSIIIIGSKDTLIFVSLAFAKKSQ